MMDNRQEWHPFCVRPFRTNLSNNMKETEEIKKDVDTAVDEETQATEETTEIPVEDEKTDLEKANEKIAELEDKYKLGFGIKPDNEDLLFETVEKLLSMDNRKEIFQGRRQEMLSESINFADFLTNYIESYPIKHKR